MVQDVHCTVRAEIFAVVLFLRISRVKPSRKFPLQFMSIYSNDNISKINTSRITAPGQNRENNGAYSHLN